MPNKLLSIYILVILFIPVTFLLWYGEIMINEKAVVGYSVFNFLDSRGVISESDLSALSFKIENLEEKDIEYTISASLNSKPFFTRKILVNKRDKAIIKVDEKIIKETLEENSNEYLVSLKWERDAMENKETLKKIFSTSNDEK